MALPIFPSVPDDLASPFGAVVLKDSILANSLLAACLAVGLLLPPMAVAQDSVLGLPRKAVRNQGALLICGGGTTPKEVHQRFVQLAGGAEGRVIIVPSAATFENVAELKSLFSTWLQLEVASIEFLDTDSRAEADNPAFVEPLRKATGVWIAGGSQGRLTDIFKGTLVEREIQAVLERGGVVGGTSAGAAVMSETMIRHGRTPDSVVLGEGFSLLTRAVVDQHFSERRRLNRLIRVLYDHPGKVGLGIDECTALVVQGDQLSVVGESTATICRAATANRPQWVHKLKSGDEARLSLVSGTDEVLEVVRLERTGK